MKPASFFSRFVRAALRRLWQWCPSRKQAMKRDGFKCVRCGKEADKAKGVKLNVHHLQGIDWQAIERCLNTHLFVKAEYLETLCKECHAKEKEVKHGSR